VGQGSNNLLGLNADHGHQRLRGSVEKSDLDALVSFQNLLGQIRGKPQVDPSFGRRED